MNVSVWIGTSPSWEILDDHLTFTFTEDGIANPCKFGEAFRIDWFDDDFRETSRAENKTQKATELLDSHSSGDEIAKALGRAYSLPEPCNAIVLPYEFEYLGRVDSANVGGDTPLRFLGCVDIP